MVNGLNQETYKLVKVILAVIKQLKQCKESPEKYSEASYVERAVLMTKKRNSRDGAGAVEQYY